jgi:hypothetical protein
MASGAGNWFLLGRTPHFDLAYLPSYHAELNLVNSFWKQFRYETTADHYLEAISNSFHAFRRQQRFWRTQKINSLCKIA